MKVNTEHIMICENCGEIATTLEGGRTYCGAHAPASWDGALPETIPSEGCQPPLVHPEAQESGRLICFLALLVVCGLPCLALYLLIR